MAKIPEPNLVRAGRLSERLRFYRGVVKVASAVLVARPAFVAVRRWW
jgi:hypothetical protein